MAVFKVKQPFFILAITMKNIHDLHPDFRKKSSLKLLNSSSVTTGSYLLLIL
ncbi:hypothetical protein [Chryseobacterium sp.]|uniref:hypothetical protein n=1 Tax=Chryseobacterium sp. TaxID=1871047 RepID=UPI0025C0B025|nr:hypothetical protein [Chryseobacterium sp.]MBV8326224.1 hypothetical protein [Chryseobacterium sp.]